MSVAIRTAVRIQDQDDAPTLGAGQDGYALTWDNASGAFVATALSAGVTDHGALTGLTPDDDHTQYALLAGRAGGQTLYGGTAANDDITIHGTSNATRTTSYVLLQPSGGNVGIGTTAPNSILSFGGTDPTLSTDTTDGADNKRLLFCGGGAVSILRGAYFYFSGNEYGGGNSGRLAFAAGAPTTPTGNDGTIAFFTTTAGNTAERLYITSPGNVGIGTTAPGTLLHSLLTSAATNAVTNVVTIGHNTSGTAANGFGAGQLFALESSTTAGQSAARIQALWYEATHATFKADLVGTAYDAGGEREGWRVRGNGSAAAIGFLGAAPVARQAHVADPAGGATVDAEARSAINSILATLEGFGFHATS